MGNASVTLGSRLPCNTVLLEILHEYRHIDVNLAHCLSVESVSIVTLVHKLWVAELRVNAQEVGWSSGAMSDHTGYGESGMSTSNTCARPTEKPVLEGADRSPCDALHTMLTS